AMKPSDWIDEEFMDDPNDVKPSDWDNEPEKIVDASATKPEDWDDDEDGTWEAPLIDNPAFKGEWKSKRIPNPAFKGPWVHPHISNPDFVERKDVHARDSIGFVGIEVWQVKAGTLFSDFILADTLAEVEQFYNERVIDKEGEQSAKKAFDQAQEEEEKEANKEQCKKKQNNKPRGNSLDNNRIDEKGNLFFFLNGVLVLFLILFCKIKKKEKGGK
ncbi:Calreticulin precursor, partial [Reticulomyxa filosa]